MQFAVNQNCDRVELRWRFGFLSRVQDCEYLGGSTSRKRGNQLDVRCGGFRFEDGARLERWNQR